MTELRRLARKKGIHYKDIAEHFECKRWEVRQAATTRKVLYDDIMNWLNTFDDVDPLIILRTCHKLDLAYAELSRRCGLHEERLNKIVNGGHVFYRWIQDRVLEVAYETKS